jgi:hypothetical protein
VTTSTHHPQLHELRSREPAETWLEAYPVGNGMRGAMCGGLSGGERLWLNDITACHLSHLSGRVLRARADVIVDLEWTAGRLRHARIRAGARPVRMKMTDPDGTLATLDLEPGAITRIDERGRGTSW